MRQVREYPRIVASDRPRADSATPSVEVVRWPALDALDALDAVVTTRAGGVSSGVYASANLGLHVGDDPDAVVENRRRAAAAVGATLDDLVICEQVHGADVVVVGPRDAGRGTRSRSDAPVGDAVVTTTPGLAVAMLVADCVPIVLVDPTAGVVACVHAGWRGTVAGVAAATIDAMVSVGADPNRLVAGIGPAIDAERYVVGPEVAEAVADALGDDAADALAPGEGDRWHCDLVAANRITLLRAGLRPDAVHTSGRSTDDPAFFSDRRARPCGRFGVVARLRGQLPVPPATVVSAR